MLFSVLCGTGMQIILMTFIVLFFACLGFLSPANRGSLATTGVVLFTFMGTPAGYVAARLYKTFGGEAWKSEFWFWKKKIEKKIFEKIWRNLGEIRETVFGKSYGKFFVAEFSYQNWIDHKFVLNYKTFSQCTADIIFGEWSSIWHFLHYEFDPVGWGLIGCDSIYLVDCCFITLVWHFRSTYLFGRFLWLQTARHWASRKVGIYFWHFCKVLSILNFLVNG